MGTQNDGNLMFMCFFGPVEEEGAEGHDSFVMLLPHGQLFVLEGCLSYGIIWAVSCYLSWVVLIMETFQLGCRLIVDFQT